MAYRLLALTCCLLLCACGGRSTRPEGSPAAGGSDPVPPAAGLPALPDPASLGRTPAYIEAGISRKGAEFDLSQPHRLASPSGSAALFLPNYNSTNQQASSLAYAVYVFQADGYDRDATLRLTWGTAPGAGLLWLGLADFSTNRWRWFNAADMAQLPLGSLANYTLPDGRVFAAVVVAGNADVKLDQIRLGGQPPQVQFSQDTSAGAVPLTVTFAFSATDADGTVALYEIDFDGDGTYDFSSPGAGSTPHDYTAAGSFYPTLRVTDDAGLATTSQLNVAAANPGGSGPAPNMTYNPPDGGAAPLVVQFDGSTSTDADGTIVDYAWDFDGDGVWDIHGAETMPQHTYPNAGTFYPRLRVIDNDGHRSTLSALPINVTDPNNHAPVGVLQVTRVTDTFPETFAFDASASFDSDGTIARYEWDFDGDGVYELNSGTDPTVQHSYYQQADFLPAVRVTDNDTATDVATAQHLPVVTGWQSVFINYVNAPGQTSLAEINFGGTSLLALAYSGGTTLPVAVSTADPAQPGTWTFANWISPEYCTGAVSILEVADAPAVFFQHAGGTGTGGLSYVRATNSTGTTWGSTVDLLTGGAAFTTQVDAMLVNDRPTVIYGGNDGKLSCWRASDSLGASWAGSAALIQDRLDQLDGVGIGSFDGNPSVVATHSSSFGQMYFSRASNSNGSVWPASPVELDPSVYSDSFRHIGLLGVGGNPAVAYFDYDLYFKRSTDADGAAWDAPELVMETNLRTSDITLLDNGGKPAIVCCSAFSDLLFIPALDAAATQWGPPQLVDSAGSVGPGASALRVGNTVVIAYQDTGLKRVKVSFMAQP
jgi:PKD repeat protein